MSEDLVENILMDEREDKRRLEEQARRRIEENYLRGPLDTSQLDKVAALAEIMDNNQAYAEAALRRQNFDPELAADFFFQNFFRESLFQDPLSLNNSDL